MERNIYQPFSCAQEILYPTVLSQLTFARTLAGGANHAVQAWSDVADGGKANVFIKKGFVAKDTIALIDLIKVNAKAPWMSHSLKKELAKERKR